MNISYGDKSAGINIDSIKKIIIEPKHKTIHGEYLVIFFNDDKTRAADFTIDSRKGALEFANYVLSHMVADGAKHFRHDKEAK
jgi:hypothetical protein